MRLRDPGDPGRQIMEKPMEKLVKHAFLPFVRNNVGLRDKIGGEAGSYSALPPETSGPPGRRHFRQIYALGHC
jgi:hypothetical protein